MARLTLEMEATDRGSSEQADLAIKVFELSQTLVQKWLTADFSAKRQLLEIVADRKFDSAGAYGGVRGFQISTAA